MSNEHDDLSSAERAAKKAKCTCGISVSADCAVHGIHAARRFPIKLSQSGKFELVAVDVFKHIEPPRHPATDLVTALKLLKKGKWLFLNLHKASTNLSDTDIQLWIGRVEKLLEMFPNLK